MKTFGTQSEPRWEFEVSGQLRAPAVLPPRIIITEQSVHTYSQRCIFFAHQIHCQYDPMVRITASSKHKLHIPIQNTAVDHVLTL